MNASKPSNASSRSVAQAASAKTAKIEANAARIATTASALGAGGTIGTVLKKQREARSMSLAEVSRVTRIPATTLQSIESDQFDDLPGEVFVRGFLRSYAQALQLDPDEILARYTSSRRAIFVTPLPVASPVQSMRGGDGQGRRFGVAIAFVLLLILFTLALSIVLKPRGHDMPHELSQTDGAYDSTPVTEGSTLRA